MDEPIEGQSHILGWGKKILKMRKCVIAPAQSFITYQYYAADATCLVSLAILYKNQLNRVRTIDAFSSVFVLVFVLVLVPVLLTVA